MQERKHALWLSLLLLLFWMGASRSLSAAENLIHDGDFEQEFKTILELPNAWCIWGSRDGKRFENFSRDTTNPHNGKASLHVFRPAMPDNQWFGILATPPHKLALTPKPGKRYTVSFWARTSTPDEFLMMVGGYKSVDPFVDGKPPTRLYYKATKQWQKFSISFTEGKNFFASDAKFMYLMFFLTTNVKNRAQDRHLWLDDIQLIEEDAESHASLINPKNLDAKLSLRLKEGARIDVQVKMQTVLHPTNKLVGGVAMLSLSRWCNTPYASDGSYNFNPVLEKALADLQLPLTRFYALTEQEPFESVEKALDATVAYCDKINVPKQTTMLELEPWHAQTQMSPDQWASAVSHSVQQQYGFKYWEIGNEVFMTGSMYKKAKQYLEHFLQVSDAIRRVQPDAQIGLSLNDMEVDWGNDLLKQAAGKYDYVCPHLYGGLSSKPNTKFEDLVISENHGHMDRAVLLNALLKVYNPDRETYIYDSEWGLHLRAADGRRADFQLRNSNIVGTVYRAVRLLYYARENLVRGACNWNAMTRTGIPGFGMLYYDKPEIRSMVYWLYHYFNRGLEKQVLDIQGTVPYHQLNGSTAPLTPLLATVSEDGRVVRLMLVNGSWGKSYPARVSLPGFTASHCEAIYLQNDDLDAQPMVEDVTTFVHKLGVTLDGQSVRFTLPAHSVAFVMLKK